MKGFGDSNPGAVARRKLGHALLEGRLTCANPDVRGARTLAAYLSDVREPAREGRGCC